MSRELLFFFTLIHFYISLYQVGLKSYAPLFIADKLSRKRTIQIPIKFLELKLEKKNIVNHSSSIARSAVLSSANGGECHFGTQ